MTGETRFLMLSECEGCGHCSLDEKEPSCDRRYAYWSDDEAIADNPDCPHYTGMSESRARVEMAMKPKLRFWVEKADKYYN